MYEWMIDGYLDIWILGKVMDSEMIPRSKKYPHL
jgi:hypothetical protein